MFIVPSRTAIPIITAAGFDLFLTVFTLSKVHSSPGRVVLIIITAVFIFGTIATEWTNVSVLLLLIDVTRRTLMIIPYFSIKSTEAYMYELKNVVLVGYILYMEFLLMTHSVYGGRISLFTDFLIMPLWAYFVKKKFKPAIYGYAIIVLIMLILWLIWDLKINNYGIFRFRF